MWASASFVGVLIIIGLPLWWKTTEVYRVTLPYDQISAFDQLPRTISTDLKILANDEATASELAALIEVAFEDSNTIKPKIHKAVLSDELHHALESVADEHDAVDEVAAAYNLTAHNCFYVVQRRPLFQQVWLAGERVMFFRDSEDAPIVVEALQKWVYQMSVLDGGRADNAADSARRTRLPPSAGYHVVLSVVHPTPDKLKVNFDAKEAVEDYIGSFVDELSILHNFTLKSQWLYLLNFDFQAREMKDNSDSGRHYSVRRDRLHRLLTALEERAATHVAALPTVNLAMYLVPCRMAPLVIYHDVAKPVLAPVQAFMSPKWGGVVLASPEEVDCTPQAVWHPNTRLIMGTFLAQLRPLLGIPDTAFISGAFLEPLRSVSPRRWELDALLRLRTLEQITTAQRTLQSLAQLLGEISNIVINDEVGASINSAVENIQKASVLAAEGDIIAAYETSKRAYLAAETAFMDPSLLALLYFPDDQKYAIYIPLFLPIMFPVVLSLKNLLLWFRGKPVHKDKTD
ncbi:unnamed protein product [Diatraea saccharalis]|uniref:GPI transamidase component PIG-S n=1 Tax=Diatraea saccharalis TaxID=40085 RepID=A0A9N9R7Q9_9NEOP|nr:unnamed protein product [Diatraea saccharalis]